MANYTKSTNFAVKDTLTTGDPQKIVSGVEIDTEFVNISSMSSTKIDKVGGATAGNVPTLTAGGSVQDSGLSLGNLSNGTFAVKQSTQSIVSSSANQNFVEVTGWSPSLSITVPSDRSDAEIQIDVVIFFDGLHSTENDVGFEFALTEDSETGGSSTITAVSRASYEYESTGASDGSNILKGTAVLRARLSPGAGTHTYKIFARNRRVFGTSTLNVRGSSTEQNSSVLIQEVV